MSIPSPVVTRILQSGLKDEQVERAREVLERGEILVTWRTSDGRVFFTGVKPRPTNESK